MPAEGHDDRLLFNRKNCRFWVLGACPIVGDRVAIAPLGHRLWIDAVALRQSPQALLTMLYRSTDRLIPRALVTDSRGIELTRCRGRSVVRIYG